MPMTLSQTFFSTCTTSIQCLTSRSDQYGRSNNIYLFFHMEVLLFFFSLQYDVYGNLFGLLAAHPVTPLVSLHHLDVVEPIFPNATRVEAIKRLTIPMKLDSASLIQQSICHDRNRRWTISVSWGFAVQIFRGIFTQREMEMPSRTSVIILLK